MAERLAVLVPATPTTPHLNPDLYEAVHKIFGSDRDLPREDWFAEFAQVFEFAGWTDEE